MKKHLLFTFLLSFFLFFSSSVSAQSYSISFPANGFTANTSPTAIHAAGVDDALSGVLPIGFNFTFGCSTYTQFRVSSNGWLTFNTAYTGSDLTNSLASGSNKPVISPLWDDLQVFSSGSINYKLSGTTPNRVLTIEWNKMQWQYSSGTDVISFQVKLYETSNLIDFVYLSGPASPASGSASIGFAPTSNAGDYYSLNGTGATPTLQYGTETSNLSAKPANGEVYRFTPTAAPAVPGCATLTTPADGATGQTKCNPTISWTAPATSGCNAPTIYYVYFGTATNPPLFDSTTTTSYQLGILNSSTQYFWRIIPKNNTGSATGCTTEFDFTTNSTACTVSPGGVGSTNVTAWFKANGLAAGNVTSWATTLSSLGGITVTDAASPYPQSTNSNTSGNNLYNYNQYVSFAGNVAGSLKVLTNSGSFALCPNSTNAADQSSFFSVFSDNPTGGTNNDNIVIWRNGADAFGSSGIQCRGLGTGVLSIGDNSNGTNASRTLGSTNLNVQQIASYTGNESSSTSMTGYWNGTVTATNNSGVASPQELSFGGRASGSELFEGVSAEHIFFNTTLSTALVNRVHTYLAVKYGITLTTNYYAPNASIIYARTGAYTNNIIGIGRDDITALLQKQSHTIDDTVRIYKGTLSTTNAANAATFAADQSYVMIGANTGKLCNTAASIVEKPAACSLYSRLEREWKVTKTNFGESFNMNIKLNACAIPASVTVTHLRLLVDDDGDFGNGGTTCYANGDGSGITFTYTNPLITITGISNTHIANNTTKYITIGSVNALTPLPIELLTFDAKCVGQSMTLNWSTASETNNDHFEVQRSVDGINFTGIAQIAGHGNSTQLQQYQYIDTSAPIGNLYYRLKQVDTDLSTNYHHIISAENNCTNSIYNQGNINIYPNPNTGNDLQLGYIIKKDEEVKVKFYDVLGKIIIEQTLKLHAETTEKTLHIGDLAKGIYFIQIQSTQLNSKPIKLIKE